MDDEAARPTQYKVLEARPPEPRSGPSMPFPPSYRMVGETLDGDDASGHGPGQRWDTVYDEMPPIEEIELAAVDWAALDATWSPDERRHLPSHVARFRGQKTWRNGSGEPLPLTLRHECNWRDTTGAWHRRLHGFADGRNRLVTARSLGMSIVWARVLEKSFYPPGDRPPDRVSVVTNEVTSEPASHDHF